MLKIVQYRSRQPAFQAEALGIFAANNTKSKAAVEKAANVVAWMHFSAGLTVPSRHSLVRAMLEGLQHTLAKSIIKKELIKVEMVEVMVRDVNSSDFWLITACLLGFLGFLCCFDELITLRPCDCSIIEMLKICIHILK